MTLSVLIVDDHPLVATALAGVLRELRPNVICRTAHSGVAARKLLAQDGACGLVLLDLALPDVDGFGLLAHLRDCYSHIPVMVVSASENVQDMRRAIAAGALGYVAKSESPATILKAAATVCRGELYLPPALHGAPLRPGPDSEKAVAALLSERQIDVLRLMCVGRSNKVIAYELGLAEKTVKGRVTAIFKALGVDSRMQAVLRAAKLGLFALEQLPAQAESGPPA